MIVFTVTNLALEELAEQLQESGGGSGWGYGISGCSAWGLGFPNLVFSFRV